MLRTEGCDIVVPRHIGEERYSFATASEAEGRAAFITEALSWVATPFVHCGDIKGRNGAVDCAMLLVRSAVDTGLITPVDPRPYPPRWMVHRTEERFLNWLIKIGLREVETPQVGDIVVFHWCQCYSHGAILVNSEEVVHAYAAAHQVIVSRLDEALLKFVPVTFANIARPVRYFSLWG